MLNPLQYSIYKGMGGNNGAVQFNFQPPHFYKVGTKIKDFNGSECFEEVDGRKRLREGWKEREGCIFLEITCTKDKNVYDWEQKIIMALSVNDMGKVLMTLLTGDDCKIMHDPGAKTQSAGAVKKFLNISSPNGTKAGCFVTATQTSGDQKRTHKVPLDGAELLVLRQLLNTAVSKALNW
jgi:hypothetical protein